MGTIHSHLTDHKLYLQRAEKSKRETTVNSCFFKIPVSLTCFFLHTSAKANRPGSKP